MAQESKQEKKKQVSKFVKMPENLARVAGLNIQVIIQTLLTNQKDKSPWQHATKHRHNERFRCHMFSVEISENRNTESLKDVVGIQYTSQDLYEITDYITPSQHWGSE